MARARRAYWSSAASTSSHVTTRGSRNGGSKVCVRGHHEIGWNVNNHAGRLTDTIFSSGLDSSVVEELSAANCLYLEAPVHIAVDLQGDAVSVNQLTECQARHIASRTMVFQRT